MNGLYFNIQRFSIHDGPGIRTTVFLKGCPLSCCWCHNPESITTVPELGFIESRCIGCHGCRDVCPGDPFGAAGDRRECTVCGSCAEFCPANARHVIGERIAVPELIERIDRDRVFHNQSGGGVTFSGGEPLMQPEFLLAALDACRERAIHTAVDTSGYAELALLQEVAARANLLLYDLKHSDDASHRRFTGVPVTPIIENLTALSRESVEIWIRIPLIPGINDDDNTVRALGELIARLSQRSRRSPSARFTGITRVSLLPYHKMGTSKYRLVGSQSPPPDLPAVSPNIFERARSILAEMDLVVSPY